MVKRARELSSSYGRTMLLLFVFAAVIGAAALSARQAAYTGPVLSAAGNTVPYGNYVPNNSFVDSGERVTVNLTLSNSSLPTSNLVGTLVASPSLGNPSGPQTYGVIGTGASATRQYRFTAAGGCGGTVIATLQLQDGATSLNPVQFPFTIGAPFAEAFDNVTAPALPVGWSTAVTGSGVPWVTNNVASFSAPNSAFTSNPASPGTSELVTNSFIVPYSPATQLQFKNYYNTESLFDGMVLEISIDGGAYADITTGGNGFLSGGYNGTLGAFTANPLGGREAWTGLSSGGGFIASMINLPVTAQGHSVRLKWRMATDASVPATGVRIDSVAVTTGIACSAVPQVFTDTVSASVTTVRALHIAELRMRIDAQRLRFGLNAYPWTDPVLPPGTVSIQAAHILQMRAALAEVHPFTTLGSPIYLDPTLAGVVVKAPHINQLRSVVQNLENW